MIMRKGSPAWYRATAAAILRDQRYCTLATTDGKRPWAAPLFFAAAPGKLYFISPIASRHARDLAGNPRVAVAIFDSAQQEGAGTGLQIEGSCALVPAKDMQAALACISAKRVSLGKDPLPPGLPLHGEQRLFCVAIEHVYMPDEAAWAREKIDRRVEVKVYTK
ncbi:MAG: pyridoxamine 5'-phosphate oxidase family protein [Candidatus Aenigmarchaeota archaeon]|nr:pyridoxamine 5'-phosphate oxidase family protein [Candidatus Aenigmarchaeota archaeon]